MVKEISYGIIPVRKYRGSWRVLLVQHQNGRYWSFPKGHPEKGEKPLEAATRELLEETGLTIKSLVSEQQIEEHYFFKHSGVLISKTVYYFVAEVKGKIRVQEAELEDAKWFSLSDAESTLTYPGAKKVLQQANSLL